MSVFRAAGAWMASACVLWPGLSCGAGGVKGIGGGHGAALPGASYLLRHGLSKEAAAVLAHGGVGKGAVSGGSKATITVAAGINAFVLPAPSTPGTGVVSDGSLGKGKGSYSSGTYTIPATVGTQVRGNLFESFSLFNLLEGEVADFTGPSSVEDIIARITGGSASSINGTIESDIQGANLFLINPAGVIFGPHASLNVSGAFTVSTADYAKLANGGKFNATLGAGDALTAGSVDGFGFQDATHAPVNFTDSRFVADRGLNIIAGDITLYLATLAVSSSGGLNIIASNIFTYDSYISTGTGNSAATGNISLTAKEITMSLGSDIDSSTSGSGKASNVTLRAQDISIFFGSEITSFTNGPGKAGNVILSAKDITMSLGSEIDSSTGGSGKGGNVILSAQDITFSEGGFVFAGASGSGKGGDVIVRAQDITISSFSRLDVPTYGLGDAGNVVLNAAGKLDIEGGGSISASTLGLGKGGDVTVTAQNITISGAADGQVSGIFAQSKSSTHGGAPGDVVVNATGAVQIEDGGEISSSTDGLGQGGSVNVTAQNITISGATADGQNASGIFALSESSTHGGAAGDVAVNAGTVEVEEGGEISSSTLGSGKGGDVNITAPDITISGGEITANSQSSTQGGPAGGISIQCEDLTLKAGGTISTNAVAASAGDISVTAQQDITLENQGSISSSAGISGGNIVLSAGDLLYVLDSSITATAGALRNINLNGNAANGGNITLDPEFIVLDDSLISANAAAGQGGNIVLESNYYLNSGGTITATGATSGTITIASPELDLSGALVGLPAAPVASGTQLQETCAMAINGDFSSFLAVGQGDIEAGPDEAQGDSGQDGREHRKAGRRTGTGF